MHDIRNLLITLKIPKLYTKLFQFKGNAKFSLNATSNLTRLRNQLQIN